MQLDDFNDFAPSSGAASGGGQGDFLARERELLGDEFGPTPTGLPSSSDFNEKSSGFPEFESSAPSATQNSRPSSDFVSSFERDPPKQQSASVAIDDDDEDEDDLVGGGGAAAVGGNDDAVQQFQSQYPDLDLYPAQPQQTQSQPSQQQVCSPV